MKSLLLAVTILVSTSCSAQEVSAPVQPNQVVTNQPQVLVDCTYKYDSKYNVEFLESNKSEYHPPQFPQLLVYRITDTHGVNWAINQYDWDNYTCTKTSLPNG